MMMIQPTPQIHHHMQITRLNNIDYFNFIFSDTKMNPNEYRCACVCQNVNNWLDHHLQINDNISNGIKSLQGLTAAATLFFTVPDDTDINPAQHLHKHCYTN